MADYYFYYGGVDYDWETTGNWWSDALHTTPAGGAPGALDDVTTVGDPGTGPIMDLSTATVPASIDATDTGITFHSPNGGGNSMLIAVTGDITATGDVRIGGAITGDAVFNDNSYTDDAVSGTATFNDESHNEGNVAGACTFNDDAYNDGAGVCASATFNDRSYNDGEVTGAGVFNDNTYNGENGTVGDMTLNDLAQNRAGVTGDFTENRGYGINGSEILGMP